MHISHQTEFILELRGSNLMENYQKNLSKNYNLVQESKLTL